MGRSDGYGERPPGDLAVVSIFASENVPSELQGRILSAEYLVVWVSSGRRAFEVFADVPLVCASPGLVVGVPVGAVWPPTTTSLAAADVLGSEGLFHGVPPS